MLEKIGNMRYEKERKKEREKERKKERKKESVSKLETNYKVKKKIIRLKKLDSL